MANNKKDLKLRIKSVKSTQKITKAMKMVSAAKLRRARENLEAALPYIAKMQDMVNNLAATTSFEGQAPELLVGNGKDKVHLIIVITSDRGLCGAFNSSIVKTAKKFITDLLQLDKTVKILCVGKKGYEQLKGSYDQYIIGKIEGLAKKQITYTDGNNIAKTILADFVSHEFDVCTVIYNKFKNAITQITTTQQLIPVPAAAKAAHNNTYEYEPGEEDILNDLLPRNVAIQLYHALLENATSEQGARMTAMDNATSNAGEMIKNLTLLYNRTRQAAITTELIEIISGAEAL